ncbi:hypothetical protein DERP_009203 [Dermatophagoides pteronyssinus]|uniref:Uncharacterized protein n=1 Tax=Dermatophagoides pteronyssinus TaxID=6956 RepID=A0ABQ8JQY2_DERPT|nr:hypothetical protein DERP_009203 [Dermatophagoides pteronyssinus]
MIIFHLIISQSIINDVIQKGVDSPFKKKKPRSQHHLKTTRQVLHRPLKVEDDDDDELSFPKQHQAQLGQPDEPNNFTPPGFVLLIGIRIRSFGSRLLALLPDFSGNGCRSDQAFLLRSDLLRKYS